MEEGGEKDECEEVVQHMDSAYESGDRDNITNTKTSGTSEDKKQGKSKKTAKQEVTFETGFHIYIPYHTYFLVNVAVCFRPIQQQSSP